MPGEVSGCPTLVPEAACVSEVSADLGTGAWLCVERLSLGSLPREASLQSHFLWEGAGLLGEVPGTLCWSLKQTAGGLEVAAGRARAGRAASVPRSF